MHKTSLPLIPITLFLGMSTAWGQGVSLDHQPMTPTQAALSELVLTELLAATGGEEALFRAVTGTSRLPAQKLFINVPEAALQVGVVTYPRQPELLPALLWDQAALCQQPAPVTAPAATGGKTEPAGAHREADVRAVPQQMQLTGAKVISSKSLSIANTGKWSAVRANPRAPEWLIDVTPEFDTSGAVPAQRFRFLPRDTQPAVTPDTVLRFDTPLIAGYGTKVVYRQQAVLMRGSLLPFTATAMVTSAVPLNFNVRTIGATGGFYFNAGEMRVMQLTNLPAEGASVPARDARLGARVLQSPNAAYLLGRETGTSTPGAYSVVDAMRSVHPATGVSTLQRAWTTLSRGSCTDSDLVLNTAGDLIFLCNGTGRALYQNTDGSKPCRLLTLSDAGELICQTGHSGPGDGHADAQVVFQTKAPTPVGSAGPMVDTQLAYQKTWLQLTGSASKSFSFSGLYSGDRVVSPVVYCADPAETLPVQPQACARALARTRVNRSCPDLQATLVRLRGVSQDTASTQP